MGKIVKRIIFVHFKAVTGNKYRARSSQGNIAHPIPNGSRPDCGIRYIRAEVPRQPIGHICFSLLSYFGDIGLYLDLFLTGEMS